MLATGAACADDQPVAVDDRPTGAPSFSDAQLALQPAGATPEGFRRFTCDLTTVDGPVTFVLDLPKDFERTTDSLYSNDCTFLEPGIRVSDDMSVDGAATGPDTYEPEIAVTVNATRDGEHALRDTDEENEQFLVTDAQPFGDDSVMRSDLEQDVPTFGATIGDRLAVDCYCDGQNTMSRSAEAAGILVQWFSVQQLSEETDSQWAQSLASAGSGTG